MNTYIGFLSIALTLLAAHWYSDFVLQTRWQAENKSKNNIALSRHVGTYCLGFFVLLTISSIAGTGFTFTGIVLYILLNGVLHWITDFTTSRITSHFWAQKNVHSFFVVIGIDQFIHAACLLVTAPILFT